MQPERPEQPEPIIGILAGMGPHSTAPFLELVLDECRRQCGAVDDDEFPPIQILSWPVPFHADRAVDEAAVARATRRGLEQLAASGVSFVGIACNTAHAFFPALAANLPVPVLDMVELAAAAASDGGGRVAVVAARPTVASGIYQRAFAARGYEPIDVTWQDTVDRLLTVFRGSPAEVPDLWAALSGELEASRPDCILVACADLTATRHHLAARVPVLDATAQLAAALVSRWRAVRGPRS